VIQPRIYLCNGICEKEYPLLPDKYKPVELNSNIRFPNVNVFIELYNITNRLNNNISPRMRDLLEIASYIYCGDIATSRGSHWTNKSSIESWQRELKYVIPVRDYDFWTQSSVIFQLRETLNFLTNDIYDFEFRKLNISDHDQMYIKLSEDKKINDYIFDKVVLFSGGLDSLAGAIESLHNDEKIILVSHRSNAVLDSRQRKLFFEIQRKYKKNVYHIPVWVNKAKGLSNDYTQRARSFLFSSLGAIVAHSLSINNIRFYENGTVSINLPVAEEVVRARASRTTHPKTLFYFQKFFSLVTEKKLNVENPFIYCTKTDVVTKLKKYNAEHLIPLSCSCAHPFEKTKTQWHCGICSQCIDRRVAILSSGLSEYDSDNDYITDVFLGKRKIGPQRNMALGYIKLGLDLYDLDESVLYEKFSLEISRAIENSDNRSEAAGSIISLLKRHGETVRNVFREQYRSNSDKIIDGEIEPSSILGLVIGQKHNEKSWMKFANRIFEILNDGIPIICQTEKPDIEPRLQEMCDGLLSSNGEILDREYPFVQWASRLTKPDWQSEEYSLFVELKYIREKSDISRITRSISSDITTYGDNGRKTLFVVYDPYYLLISRDKFVSDIEKHDGQLAKII